MNSQKKNGFFSHLQDDFPASIVVFLVAVPLCLGIALASGAPLFSGIISGVIGGTIVTMFSKSQLGVSGPAAGLIVIVINSVDQLGSFEPFLLAVFIAGIMQILLGIGKAGLIGYYLPSSVIKGMLSGIGILIILKQIPHAIGYDLDPEGEMEFFQPDGHNTFSTFAYMFDLLTPGAVLISVLSLIILIVWEKPFMKNPVTRIVQGPLVAVLVGIGLNVLLKDHELFSLHGEHVVSIPITQTMGEFFGQFSSPDFSYLFDQRVYIIALTLAIVASLETLLSVEATDKLDPQRRITPTNRELIAQGIGNSASGLLGGLPITQVIVRSSTNIMSGGKTRASAFLHGIWLLLAVVLIPNFLNLIPLSSLAAILIIVGTKLIKPSIVKSMYKSGTSQFYSYLVTVVGIVFTDLLIGIILGLVTAIMFILWNNFKNPYHFDPEAHKEGDPIKIEMSEEVSFLNKAGIIKTFDILPENTKVILDASRTKSMHWDVLEAIDDFKVSAPNRGIDLKLVGFDKINSGNALDHLHAHVKGEQKSKSNGQGKKSDKNKKEKVRV